MVESMFNNNQFQQESTNRTNSFADYNYPQTLIYDKTPSAWMGEVLVEIDRG